MAVKATTVVSFNGSDDTEYIFNIELDDILNLDSEGNTKTSFSPSDIIYLIVNRSSNVDIEEIVCTDGTILSLGMVTREGVADNLFTSRDPKESDEFSLSHVPSSVTKSYVGRTGFLTETVSSIGNRKYIPEQTLTPFLTKFTYSFQAISYEYTPPGITLGPEESYDVAIVFYIKVR
jgi:hypothetical protein